MTIEDDDLEAAVAAGVVTQAQADALATFAAGRAKSGTALFGLEDERFRFMRGFNDFFLAIGILLFGSGVSYLTAARPIPSLIAAGIVWGLSELLVNRMRLVLPGILLSIFFVVFMSLAVPTELFPAAARASPATNLGATEVFLRELGARMSPALGLAKALIAAAAAALYYWRFRLPFTLLPIAACLVLAVFAAVATAAGSIPPALESLITLGCGLCVFGVAMRFDMSDRNRVTRRADCAFWLHLLAAPLIVHSLVSFVTPNVFALSSAASVAIVLIVLALAIVAIAVDRRALLVSALLYVGVVIAYTLSGTFIGATGQTFIFFTTLLVLGSFVIALGVGWLPIRRRLVACLPARMTDWLPPVPHGA